jgi:deoxyguanosine kinase
MVRMPDEKRTVHIAIEGPIGVGKTSLTMLLSWELNLKPFFEPVDRHPYLADFYSDSERFAFPTQLFFLVKRFQKQLRLQKLKQAQSVVSDFYFQKDLVFAILNLKGRDKEMYDRIVGEMLPFVEQPDLILYLDAPLPSLMERIRRRGRQVESSISEAYEEALRLAYRDFFLDFQQSPLLPIDTTFLDFVNRETDKRAILQVVRSAFK